MHRYLGCHDFFVVVRIPYSQTGNCLVMFFFLYNLIINTENFVAYRPNDS
jgi:hypothetical protein